MKQLFKGTSNCTILTFIIFVLTGCGTSSVLQHPTTSATLWTQNSAEHKALTSSIYRTATANLGLALEDSYWTAYPNQENKNIRKLPAAVILDVDETVLDNSAYQARMIKQGKEFDPELWNKWVMEAKADPIAGALKFTQTAAKKGVNVFYVTNREAKVEEGTRENLRNIGFPLSDEEDRILSKNERDNWTSAKTERRAFVAKDHRIIMLFGDDLNDFISAKGISQQKRDEMVKTHEDKWGQKWYILPNPVYGSWENALYDFRDDLSSKEIQSIKKERLNTKNQ